MKRAYLDQWVWIRLGQAYYGKSKEWEPALKAVQAAQADGRFEFPLSLSHLQEIANRKNDASRTRLVEFIQTLWRGEGICPWSHLVKPETRNAVRRALGRPAVDLDGMVFGKGIGKMLGVEPVLVPTVPNPEPIPPDKLALLNAHVFGPEILTRYTDPVFAAESRRVSSIQKAYTSQVQALVTKDYSHPDKKRRQDIARGTFIMGMLGEHLPEAVIRLGGSRTLLDKMIGSRQDVEALVKSIPTLHTFDVLNHARNMARKVDPNDFGDFALNNAIPYCDVVATERSWSNFAISGELDETFGTAIVSSPDGLVTALG